MRNTWNVLTCALIFTAQVAKIPAWLEPLTSLNSFYEGSYEEFKKGGVFIRIEDGDTIVLNFGERELKVYLAETEPPAPETFMDSDEFIENEPSELSEEESNAATEHDEEDEIVDKAPSQNVLVIQEGTTIELVFDVEMKDIWDRIPTSILINEIVLDGYIIQKELEEALEDPIPYLNTWQKFIYTHKKS